MKEGLWIAKPSHCKSFNNLLKFIFQKSEVRKMRRFKTFLSLSVSAQGQSSLLSSCLRQFSP